MFPNIYDEETAGSTIMMMKRQYGGDLSWKLGEGLAVGVVAYPVWLLSAEFIRTEKPCRV
jgi:hypothetical protein